MAFFSKTKQIMSAIKRVPKLKAMYKALCPQCKETIKTRIKAGENDVNNIIKQFCKECQALQK